MGFVIVSAFSTLVSEMVFSMLFFAMPSSIGGTLSVIFVGEPGTRVGFSFVGFSALFLELVLLEASFFISLSSKIVSDFELY